MKNKIHNILEKQENVKTQRRKEKYKFKFRQ